jgi:hypothetical protein
MTELSEAYPDPDLLLEEVEVCNNCLEHFHVNVDGDCCIGCNDEMTVCRKCLPEKNTIHYKGKKLAFCDYCGATYRDSDTVIYDDTYYELIESEYDIPKEDFIKEVRHLQQTWFNKNQMLERIGLLISKLEMEIDDLREEARYISSLREED